MVEADPVLNSGNNLIRVSNYKEAMEALIELEFLDFISYDNNNLKSLYIYSARTKTILIEPTDYDLFKQILDGIILRCTTAISVIDKIIPTQNEFSVSIKLPPVNTLSELSEITKDISNALEQTLLHPKIAGRVELQNFDSGSNWFEVLLGNKEALVFLGGLVWSALELHKKMIENSTLKQRLESLKIKNNTLKTLEETLSKLTDSLEQELSEQCQNNALKILKENNISTTDNEYNMKVAHSIKMIAQLIFKGAEFHQPSIAKSNSKQIFPNFKDLNLLKSPAMQLEQNLPDQES